MEYFKTFILMLFDVSMYYLAIKKLNEGKIEYKKIDILKILAFTALVSFFGVVIAAKFGYFIVSATMIFFNYSICKKNINVTLFSHVINTIILFTTQLISLIPAYLIMGELDNKDFKTGVLAQVISLIAIIILTRFAPIEIVMGFIEKSNKMFKIICLNLFALLTTSVLYWNANIQGLLTNMIVIVTFSICFLIINIIVLGNGLKNADAEATIKAYETYIPIVNNLTEELRTKQHDFDNHLTTIRLMIASSAGNIKELDYILEYVNEAEAHLKDVYLVKLKNIAILGFLIGKKKQAENENIDLKIILESFDINTVIKDFDLIEILSILVDNAFETGIKDNKVIITIGNEKDNQYIEVQNKFKKISSNVLDMIFEKDFSTKEEHGRGLGLFKLRKILSKYHAEPEATNKKIGEEEFVSFKIVLP